MHKLFEQEQTQDLKLAELRDAYENDLVIIQRCIDQLVITRQQRTFEYEQAYLKVCREYEEQGRFDECREMTPPEREDVD